MTSFDAKMEPLRQRFVARSRQDLSQLLAHQSDCPLAPVDLRALVHRLAGSAGLFGYPAISALACDVETELLQGGEAATLPQLICALGVVASEDA
jgi:HPt (histidine-containing phosphotransfer) domain-containing protein